jgi:DNA-binding NarL/FixJ family response regulator
LKKLKIIIADSYYLSRKGLASIIKDEPRYELVAEAATDSDLVDSCEKQNPDIVVIDYTSTNFNLDSIDLFVKQYPAVKFLAITDYLEDGTIHKSLEMGVSSHLLKECDAEEIVEAIDITVNGGSFVCGTIANLAQKNKAGDTTIYACNGSKISEREIEIITYVAQGFSNKDIAEKLFLSAHTITTHRKNIMNKLSVSNTAGLVMFAVREKLVDPNQL